MRAFVAIDVPDRVLDSLAAFQSELSRTGADLKLVERQNQHITVKFLGEIGEPEARDAESRLARLALKGATVELRGVGAFPPRGGPRVVWAGVAPEDAASESSIAGEAIAALEGIGERDDRPFQAHITLARVRSQRSSRQLGELLMKNSGRPFGTVEISELKLKSSALTPSGPVYTDLGVYRLS